MKSILLALAVAGALTSTALAQSVSEKTGVNSVLGITPKTEDFIKEAATSDMLEIEAAKIAQQKGNADEKKFAEAMITDHTKTSTELKGLVSGELKPALPSALDDASQKKLDKLRDAKPENFAVRPYSPGLRFAKKNRPWLSVTVSFTEESAKHTRRMVTPGMMSPERSVTLPDKLVTANAGKTTRHQSTKAEPTHSDRRRINSCLRFVMACLLRANLAGGCRTNAPAWLSPDQNRLCSSP